MRDCREFGAIWNRSRRILFPKQYINHDARLTAAGGAPLKPASSIRISKRHSKGERNAAIHSFFRRPLSGESRPSGGGLCRHCESHRYSAYARRAEHRIPVVATIDEGAACSSMAACVAIAGAMCPGRQPRLGRRRLSDLPLSRQLCSDHRLWRGNRSADHRLRRLQLLG